MKKKVVILFAVICILIIIISFVINSNIVYLGNHTKVLSFGNILFKYNLNNNIVLRKVNIYKTSNVLKGYIKTEKYNSENRYYAVSVNNKTIKLNDFIASGILKKVDIINTGKASEIDSNKVSKLNDLLEKELTIDNVYGYKEISYDIDNDNDEEDIIYTTYMENGSLVTNIFLYENGNVTNIINYENDLEAENNCKNYDLVCVINFNKDNNYEIVISVNDGDSQPTYYNIYKLENGNIKEIK